MGGFGAYSDLDIQGSKEFLLNCFFEMGLPKKKRPHTRSLDCGAGVGRISNDLLKRFYPEIHLIEIAQPLLDSAKDTLGKYPAEYFCSSLHTFEPSVAYDVCWAQVGHIFFF